MMMTKTDVRHAIGEPSFSRGADYFARGRVLALEGDGLGQVSGDVAGRGGRRYRVKIRVSESSSGWGRPRLVAHCTCPVGRGCKHIAALLLAAIEAGLLGGASAPQAVQHKGTKTAADSVPTAVRMWLDQWAPNAVSTPARTRTRTSPARDQLFYVFRLNARGRAEIVPYLAYLKKDGAIGANAKEHRITNLAHAPKFATAEDASIMARLGYFSVGTWPPLYEWPVGDTLRAFLQEVVATGRARLNDIRGKQLIWAPPRRVTFTWKAEKAGDQVISTLDQAGAPVDLLPFPEPVFADAETGDIGFAETDLPHAIAHNLAIAPPIPPDAAGQVSNVLASLDGNIPRPQSIEITEKTGLAPVPHLKLFGIEHRHKASRFHSARHAGEPTKICFPCAQVSVTYDGVDDALRPNQGSDIRLVEAGDLLIMRRDFAQEAQFLDAILDIAADYEGFAPDTHDFGRSLPKAVQDADIVFPLSYPGGIAAEASALAFAAEELPNLRAQGWQVETDTSWPFRVHEGPIAFQTTAESSGSDWFSLALTINVAEQTLNLTPIILQIIEILPVDAAGGLPEEFNVEEFLSEHILYPSLDDGTLVSVPAEQLAPFVEVFLQAQGLIGFHMAEAGRAAALAEALEGCGAPWSGGTEILELGRRLQHLSNSQDADPPPQLQAVLRPYQRIGYGWLRAISDTGFGGALADDMGLGKTVQALALLAYRHLEAGSDRPSLLVVPTSLLGNWQREAARFVPDLKVLILHGAARAERFLEISAHHLIVTTYPLINRDHEKLFAHEYDLAILDEAQAVKNPASGIAKRIREIRARQRIALTGTPVENNLAELWSLFDWLIPGLLGDRRSFNADYRKPIEQQGDRVVQQLLSTRIKPFLMRRTKEEVAADLPAKTVIDDIVPLDRAQATLYESVRSAMDARVREAIANQGLASSHITILDALLKLRQTCCDPALVKLDGARKVTESAKRARLLELLEELIAEGRRVLVYSQFVEMLHLIEGDVVSRKWRYALLHGGTKKRDAEVQKFQSGEVDLFLISLKAGGVGLNLTAADTVILYDPWWNPAVERQAMDRAHRIGQDKPVFVHRLIAENTVESAIQEMQARKQALADALFEGTGDGPLTLTEHDVTGLFEAR